MIHNEFIGLETLNKEYKEISFQHTGIPYSESDISDYLRSSKWDFNPLILQSLKKYIRIYLPKYISAFLDQKSELINESSFYIGVSDNGIVTGIPYQGDLSLDDILSDEIADYLRNHIQSDGNWAECLDIQLVKVEYTPEQIPDIHPRLKDYDKKKRRMDHIIRKHNRKYMKWQALNDCYTQKLVDLYQSKHIKKEFKRYLRSKDQMEMLKQIENGFVIEQKSYEEIRIYRENCNNLYYWLCRWKDEVLEELRKNKPVREKAFKNTLAHMDTLYGPMHIFIKTENMVRWWMQRNENMNLYVLKVSFKRPQNGMEISYRELYKEKWNRCYRSLDEKGNPCCMPY